MKSYSIFLLSSRWIMWWKVVLESFTLHPKKLTLFNGVNSIHVVSIKSIHQHSLQYLNCRKMKDGKFLDQMILGIWMANKKDQRSLGHVLHSDFANMTTAETIEGEQMFKERQNLAIAWNTSWKLWKLSLCNVFVWLDNLCGLFQPK